MSYDGPSSNDKPLMNDDPMRPLNILVVDDEQIQRDTMASILAEEGYQVVTAHDCPSAIGALSDTCFDIVLTDFRMPGGSGLDIARKATELCP